jgi:hypothetical protein
MHSYLLDIISNSKNRYDFWSNFINFLKLAKIAEVGVYQGSYAETILKQCPQITDYLMIDPWRNLSDWNKPANKDNSTFDLYFEETIQKTFFAKDKINILRGTTIEMISKIEKKSLDFIYIDGDHTLRGITIDLLNYWDKINELGFIAGDDFCPNIWQHKREFEPTFVFPYAIYFAEAVNARIFGLPFNQFLIQKESKCFEFIDLTNGLYQDKTVLNLIS